MSFQQAPLRLLHGGGQSIKSWHTASLLVRRIHVALRWHTQKLNVEDSKSFASKVNPVKDPHLLILCDVAS